MPVGILAAYGLIDRPNGRNFARQPGNRQGKRLDQAFETKALDCRYRRRGMRGVVGYGVGVEIGMVYRDVDRALVDPTPKSRVLDG